MDWNEKRTRERVRAAWDASAGVAVLPLVKETSFDNLSLTTAYLVDGVHVYVDLPNARGIVGTESERDHARMLRFLHVLTRVAHLVFQQTGAVKVDLQNTRLHFVLYRPYGSEPDRVRAAIAIAALLRDALLAGNALHAELADVQVVIGIESGKTLAVKNGTRGEREPLFLGNAANHAAKLTGPKPQGIYVGQVARAALGPDHVVTTPSTTPLTTAQIDACVKAAKLPITKDDVSRAWDDERKRTPVSEFQFSRWQPPIAGFDLDQLSPKNSKRQELVVLYADIDGFTKYVADAIASGRSAEAVRVLHVIRKELRDVLNELGGKKVRYIGDCLQGIIADGTAAETDKSASVKTATLIAAALRSAFNIVRSEISASAGLGLQIGLELGPTAVSRVGVAGSRDRCVVGKATLEAEHAQSLCKGNETAIGRVAYDAGPQAVRDAFGPTLKSPEIDYDRVRARFDRAAGARPATSVTPSAIQPRAHTR